MLGAQKKPPQTKSAVARYDHSRVQGQKALKAAFKVALGRMISETFLASKM